MRHAWRRVCGSESGAATPAFFPQKTTRFIMGFPYDPTREWLLFMVNSGCIDRKILHDYEARKATQ